MAGTVERNLTGKREDLSDIIAVVDMKKCPLFSMLKKGKAPTNTLQEWQADAYDDPQTDGVVDGTDVETHEDASEHRELIQGRLQHIRRSPKVSTLTEDVTDVAGMKKPYAAAVAKKLTELKRDIEAVLGSDNDSAADNGTDTGYKTRGLGSWISNSAQSNLPVPTAFRTPSASIDGTAINSLTEKDVSDVLTSVYEETGASDNFVLFCGSKLKRRFTEFAMYEGAVSSSATVLQRFNQGGDKKMIHNTVAIYEGDFGVIELVTSTFLANGTADAPQRRGYLVPMDMVELAFSRMPGHRELENRGGGRRGIIDAIFNLKVLNPLGFGKFNATAD